MNIKLDIEKKTTNACLYYLYLLYTIVIKPCRLTSACGTASKYDLLSASSTWLTGVALSDCSWTQPKLKSCGSAVCITTVQHRPRPSLEHCCQQQHNHASWQCLRPRYAVWQWNEHVFTVYWRRKDNLDVLSAPSTSVPIRWLLELDVTATLVTFYHSSCMARNVGPSRRKMRGKSMLSISGACGGCLVSRCTSLFPTQKFCGRI